MVSIFLDKYQVKGKALYPPQNKNQTFFIDDINMPRPDKYGTQ